MATADWVRDRRIALDEQVSKIRKLQEELRTMCDHEGMTCSYLYTYRNGVSHCSICGAELYEENGKIIITFNDGDDEGEQYPSDAFLESRFPGCERIYRRNNDL